MSKIEDPRQRGDIADVVDRLTDFEYLACPMDVTALEIEESLNRLQPTTTHAFGSMSATGRGLLYSFGMVGGLRIYDDQNQDLTREWKTSRGEQLAQMERSAEHNFLAGPTDEAVPGLRAHGYRPEQPRALVSQNLRFEQDLADNRLNPHWRHGRLRDVVLANHLYYELNAPVAAQLEQRGLSPQEIVDMGEPRSFLLQMPSQRVVIELKTSYHRNPNHKWTTNDLYDLGAMSLALPYCDVVLTDAEAPQVLCRSYAGWGSRVRAS